MNKEMHKYIGTKLIKARPLTLGEYNALQGWIIPVDQDPTAPGYLVEYTDGGKPNHPNYEGYISWSPKDVFEKSYIKTNNLTFGMVLEAMRAGQRVQRASGDLEIPHAIYYLEGGDLKKEIQDLSQGPGEMLTKEDLFATDWTIVAKE